MHVFRVIDPVLAGTYVFTHREGIGHSPSGRLNLRRLATEFRKTLRDSDAMTHNEKM